MQRHHNQSNSVIGTHNSTKDLERKKKIHSHRNMGSGNWKFVPIERESSTSFDSKDEKIYEEEETKRKRKSIAQLKKERVHKQQHLFKELELAIRDQDSDEENIAGTLHSALRDTQRNKHEMSDTMNTTLTKNPMKNDMGEILRFRDTKIFSVPEINVEKSLSSSLTLPSIVRIKSRSVLSKTSSTVSFDRSTSKSPQEPEEVDPLKDLFSKATDSSSSDDVIPPYQSLHPLEREMKETVDFPTDLLEGSENMFVEQDEYVGYRKRLLEQQTSDDEDSSSQSSDDLVERRKRINRFASYWFLPHSQWTFEDTGKLKKKQEKLKQHEMAVKNGLKDLASSKLFKLHLIKTNSAVPDWLDF